MRKVVAWWSRRVPPQDSSPKTGQFSLRHRFRDLVGWHEALLLFTNITKYFFQTVLGEDDFKYNFFTFFPVCVHRPKIRTSGAKNSTSVLTTFCIYSLRGLKFSAIIDITRFYYKIIMIAFELTQNPGKDTNVRTRNFIVLKRVFMISAYPTSGSEYQCASLYEPWITWETSTRKWQSK